MAHSKHRKRKKQRRNSQSGFFETLSATYPAQTTASQTTRPNIEQLAGTFLRYCLDMAVRNHRLAKNFISHSRDIWFYLKNLWVLSLPRRMHLRSACTNLGTTGLAYGQAIGHDLQSLARQLRRGLWGRRMRSLYLAIITAIALAGVATGTLVMASTMALHAKDLSSPAALMSVKRTGTTILDRNGQVLFQGYGAQNIQPVTLNDMPKSLKDATLAAEDPDFYEHRGYSLRAMARAAWVDITKRGKIEGGSTLTQQLVKNSLLTSDKTFERKYQEVILSMELENRYSKDQILNMYLNQTYFGQGAYGVETAAQTYFRKPVKDLSLGESALLAGLPLGPSRFDPNADPAAATERRNYVLDRMAQLGQITTVVADEAKTQPLIAYPKAVTINAPHFVFYVLAQLRSQYGENMLEHGGLTVKTTLDLAKQNAAQQIVRDQIASLAHNNVTNGGLVSITPKTGDIVSMVGSVDYSAPGFGAVNVITSELQPGSSFKPFAYVAAFEKGWNGSTQVDDVPLQLQNGDGSPYTPQNYDGKWHGKVTLRRALANSFNIPAIKVIQFAGLSETIKTAQNLGITTLQDRGQYGVSMVLGAGNVKPIDMATAYATFANNGVKIQPRAILNVSDRSGKDITKRNQSSPQKVLDPRYAYMITSILSDNRARTEKFGPSSPLLLSHPSAAKTGTTNDFRDNWTVGYTPDLATAVWVGNNDHSAMSGVDGITGAAPIWHNYMEMALANAPATNFESPPGLATARVCASDGGLANPWDTDAYDEIFMPGQQPTRHCNSIFNLLPFLQPPQPDNQPPAPSPPVDQPSIAPLDDEEFEPEPTPRPPRGRRIF